MDDQMTNPGAVFARLQPVSKRMRVVATLKDAIVSGTLRSGDRIVESKLADQFGVGQGLVREALIELDQQGFVRRSPFSLTHVTKFSNEDARQIFDIRIAVEPLAVRLAAERANPDVIRTLRSLANKAAKGVESRDFGTFFGNHLEYRRLIWKMSGNRFLMESLERLVTPLYALYLMHADLNRDGLFETIQDCVAHQQAMLEAFELGAAEEAAEIVRRFLVAMKASLGSRLLPRND